MSSGSQTVHPSTIRHTPHTKDNFATSKLTKYAAAKGGLQTKDVVKAVLKIVGFIVLGFLFYGVAIGELGTSGGRNEYSCSVDLGDDVDTSSVQVVADCSENEGWQRWDLVDCAYFVMVTITTVGYGDMGPVSTGAKWFTIFFILVGLLLIADALGIIGRFFIDQATKRKQKKQKDMENVAMAVGEKLKTASTPTPSSLRKTPSSKLLSSKRTPRNTLVKTPVSKSPPSKEEIAFKKEISKIIDTDILPKEGVVKVLQELMQEQLALLENSQETSDGRRHSGIKLPPLGEKTSPLEQEGDSEAQAAAAAAAAPVPAVGLSKGKPLSEATKPPPVNTFAPIKATSAAPEEETTIENEFRVELMRKLRLAWKIHQCFYIVYLFIILSFVLGYIEEWSALDCLYYAVVTGTTVGYGDFAPVTKFGRIFAIFLLPLGVIGLSNAVGSISSVFEDEKQGAGETLMDKVNELQRIIAEDDDGTVTEEEFTIFQLKKIYNVDDETLRSVRNQFKSLDADSSGELDENDIVQLKATCLEMGIRPTAKGGLLRRLSHQVVRKTSGNQNEEGSKYQSGK